MSNESIARHIISINTSYGNVPLATHDIAAKVTHHSPHCSIVMRQNLSPGPGYKMKERNSMFDHKNKNSSEIEKNQKLVMIKPD